MPLIVETGTGLPDAEAYASAADADAYHQARGNVGWSGEPGAKEAALRRATAFIDATYRARFPGYPTNGRGQALEWPRQGAYVTIPENGRSGASLDGRQGYGGLLSGTFYLAADEVPREIIAATCEAALRELAEPGSLAPDLERGGAIKSLRAGSVGIEYAGNAPAGTAFQALDLALAGLLMPASLYSGRAVRG